MVLLLLYIGGSLWEDTLYVKNTLYDMGNSLSYQNVLLPQNDEDIGTRQEIRESKKWIPTGAKIF